MSDVHTNDIWSLYFHDPSNQDWNLSSYIKLSDIASVEEFWQVYNFLAPKFKLGMFFFMRTDCFPCWDDPSNIDGGCLSMKVLKENIDAFWTLMCVRASGETLLMPEHSEKLNLVNGISTSPKKYFCVVKIWVRSDELNDKKYFNIPPQYNGDIFYKQNREVIQTNAN
jgi:hypothetical protein